MKTKKIKSYRFNVGEFVRYKFGIGVYKIYHRKKVKGYNLYKILNCSTNRKGKVFHVESSLIKYSGGKTKLTKTR